MKHFANDPEVQKAIAILQDDYELALVGKNNHTLFGDLPNIPLEKLADIYSKVTQTQYLKYVKISKTAIE